MLKITLFNGKEINLSKSDVLVGFDNLPATDMNRTYFAVEAYSSFYDDDFLLTTSDPELGLTGFLLTHHCFAVSERKNHDIYMTSSVKSVSIVKN